VYKLFILCLLVIAVQCSQMYDLESDFKLGGPFSNNTWQSYTADRKMQILSTHIYADTNKDDWPNVFEKTELLIESMKTSFETEGDDFPKQALGLLTRKKLIHSVGVIVKSEYIALDRSYTGVFQGCRNVLLRFSSATPVETKGGPSVMAPGIGVKFLRDKVPSANTFAMFSLVGQPSYNFFAHDFSGHVGELAKDGPTPVQLLRQRFLTASDFAPFAGLWKLAQYDEFGRAENKIKFPFRLHFHPTKALHTAFPDKFTGQTYEDQLTNPKIINNGTVIYDVYAQHEPTSDQLKLIGKLVARAPPTNSVFADKTLFYQHIKFEEDCDHNPTWEKAGKDLLEKQREMKLPGWVYPDLPWN